MQWGMRSFIVLVAVMALVACGRAAPTPTMSPTFTTLPTVHAAVSPAAGVTVTAAATLVPTSVPNPATATPRPAPAATATVRPPTPTPLAPSPTRPATAPPTAIPPTSTPSAPHVTQLPSSPPRQVVGTATDGLVLLNVRTGTHDGFTRLVFDFAKADGSAAPVPQARMWTQNGAVIVVIGGIRQDAFGQTLGAGEEPVNNGSVIALYRITTLDDATVAYGISTKATPSATLTIATGPARVIVDIAD